MSQNENGYVVQSENEGGIQVFIKRPGMRYFDQFIKQKCAIDLLEYGIFPNSKEITESYAMLAAVDKLEIPRDNGDVRVVVVGDGSTPRTGAVFAFNSRWQVWSIDPNLNKNPVLINRLTCEKKKVEEFNLEQPGTYVLVYPHSHASILAGIRSVPHASELHVVSMPCCVPDDIGFEPDKSYYDWGVWSPHRKINIYKNIKVSR